MAKYAVNILGYIQDDEYDAKAISEMLKLTPSLLVSDGTVTGVIVQEMKDNSISIDRRRVQSGRGLFNKK